MQQMSQLFVKTLYQCQTLPSFKQSLSFLTGDFKSLSSDAQQYYVFMRSFLQQYKSVQRLLTSFEELDLQRVFAIVRPSSYVCQRFLSLFELLDQN